MIRRLPSARPPLRTRWSPWSAAPPTGTRACRSCWTPSWTIMPSPAGHSRHQGRQPRHRARRTSVLPTTMRPSPLWPSRSRPTPMWAGCPSSGCTPVCSTPAPPCSTPPRSSRERIGRILQMHANHREDIETVYSGDIAAVVGLKNTTTGDTLCDEKASHHSGVHGVPRARDPRGHRA